MGRTSGRQNFNYYTQMMNMDSSSRQKSCSSANSNSNSKKTQKKMFLHANFFDESGTTRTTKNAEIVFVCCMHCKLLTNNRGNGKWEFWLVLHCVVPSYSFCCCCCVCFCCCACLWFGIWLNSHSTLFSNSAPMEIHCGEIFFGCYYCCCVLVARCCFTFFHFC